MVLRCVSANNLPLRGSSAPPAADRTCFAALSGPRRTLSSVRGTVLAAKACGSFPWQLAVGLDTWVKAMSPEQIGILVIGALVAFVVLRAAVGCLVRLIVVGAIVAALVYTFVL